MASLSAELPRDPETLQAMLIARDAEIERLRQIIKELQRHRFGRRAESLPEDQLLLALEEAEQLEAAGFAASEERVPAEKAERVAKRRANRGALPAHLPRIETVVDIGSDICPCCSGKLHRIGEDVAERLDMVPAQFRVLVVRRSKYACRSCADVVVRMSARPRAGRRAGRSSRSLNRGCGRSWRWSARRPSSRRRSVTPSRAGRDSPSSPTTAASSWTTTSWSAPSGPSP
jgi:transposase